MAKFSGNGVTPSPHNNIRLLFTQSGHRETGRSKTVVGTIITAFLNAHAITLPAAWKYRFSKERADTCSTESSLEGTIFPWTQISALTWEHGDWYFFAADYSGFMNDSNRRPEVAFVAILTRRDMSQFISQPRVGTYAKLYSMPQPGGGG